jgi:hypothetical protein
MRQKYLFWNFCNLIETNFKPTGLFKAKKAFFYNGSDIGRGISLSDFPYRLSGYSLREIPYKDAMVH